MHFNPSQVLFTKILYTPVFLRQFKLRCHKSLTARLTHNLCYCLLSPLTNISGVFWSVSCTVCQINQFISLSLWCHCLSVPIWLFVFFFYLKIGIALRLPWSGVIKGPYEVEGGGGGLVGFEGHLLHNMMIFIRTFFGWLPLVSQNNWDDPPANKKKRQKQKNWTRKKSWGKN